MTVGERIKQIRKKSDLTQDKFGHIIGISGKAVSKLEKGINTPSTQTVTLICREFGIREEWLRIGKGEMYEPQPVNVLDILTEEFDFSEKEKRIAEMFLTLDAVRRKATLEYISDLIDALNEEQGE